MEEDGIRNNLSQQELMQQSNSIDGCSVVVQSPPSGRPSLTKSQILTVVVLCYVNLINYMDRFTVSGILQDIKDTFHMTDTQSGLLQTAFVITYMFMAPIFGYLGDRFSRKYLMAVGVFFWCLTTLIGSYMPNYGLFLLFRCFVGVGEASYSTIAPTIISDMFVKDLRSKMLALFYFAIPVGSGLGYIIGAEVTQLVGNSGNHSEAWRWGLRVTPAMGLIAVLLILFVLKEPPRGESEGGNQLEATSFWEDLKYLFTNRSFILSTLAFTCVTYVAGALAWWGPIFVERGVKIQEHSNIKIDDVAFIFGAIAMTAGLLGVPLGSFTGQKLRQKIQAADPLVCGVGLLLSTPFLIGAMAMAQTNTGASFAVVFFGQLFLNMNWAVVSDIVLYTVIPTRRSSAEAFQILFSHALGDAGSPYVVGKVAETFYPWFHNDTLTSDDHASFEIVEANTPYKNDTDVYADFKSLQYSMYICALVEILGVVFFFWNALYIAGDKRTCELMTAGKEKEEPELNTHL
ncbi:lysolipid transporter protein spinster isoform X2 [Oratosquilla oratoria]